MYLPIDKSAYKMYTAIYREPHGSIQQGTTMQHTKEISFDRETRDFAMHLDGQIVGYAPTYQQAEARLDALVYELARRGADELADLASQVEAEQVVEVVIEVIETSTGRTIDRAVQPARKHRLADYITVGRVMDYLAAMDIQPEMTDAGRRWQCRFGSLLIWVYEAAAETAPVAMLPDPTPGEVEAVISALIELDSESTSAAIRACTEGETKAARAHRQAAGAYRKAAQYLRQGLRWWVLSDNGLLVESKSGAAPHRAGRFGCTCPHGIEASEGLCWHSALVEGVERWAERLHLAA